MNFDPNNVLFYIGRHGRTGDRDEEITGPQDDVLNSQGHEDARQMAQFLDPVSIAHILTSTKNRAIETAMHVGEVKNLTPTIEPNLAAFDIGGVAHLPEAQAEKAMSYFVAHPKEQTPGGESLHGFRRRIHSVFGQAIRFHHQTGKHAFLAAHDSVIREAGNVFNSDVSSALVKPGGVVAVMRQEGVRAVPIFKPDTARQKSKAAI